MKRLQIYIEEDVDEALALLALKTGTSKAALIRGFVAKQIDVTRVRDPLDRFVGDIDQEPGNIDEVVYGS